jgi:hypothetical protein
VRAGRNENGQTEVIARSEQGMVFGREVFGDMAQLGEFHARIDIDDFERSAEAIQVLREAKQAAAKGAELLGDRCSLQEAGVEDGHGRSRKRDEAAV